MWQIKKNVLETILQSARNCYPHEFLALIGGDKGKKLIDELIVIPASVYGKSFSSLRRDLVPFDFRILGSVHSHPSSYVRASRGDLISFPRMGSVHLIVGFPFDFNSVRLFDSRGKQLEYKVI